MKLSLKVFCLSLLTVALIAGSAQAVALLPGSAKVRNVNGCVIEAHTNCGDMDLSHANLTGANLTGVDVTQTFLQNATGCSTVAPSGILNGLC